MAVSELPGNPNAVWTVKKNIDGMVYFIHRDYVGPCTAHHGAIVGNHHTSCDKYLNDGEFFT